MAISYTEMVTANFSRLLDILISVQEIRLHHLRDSQKQVSIRNFRHLLRQPPYSKTPQEVF